MASLEERIQQLQSAITAQESLRATLGDMLVDTTIAALRNQLDPLLKQAQANASEQIGGDVQRAPLAPEELLARLIPKELADKMRATGRIEGERKQVTVLFADIVGFTELGERIDPEVITTVTNEALTDLGEAVYQYEGYIDKFIGDAIMAVFGAPIAHEDDPERALRAALAMRERLENFNRRWIGRLGQPLAIHIGINTGTVIAGNVGSDLRLSYTVMGDTVNTASRLEDVSQPGQILVSRDTYRVTSEAFQYQVLEPIMVKGKREPLPVFELLRAKLNPVKNRGLQGLSSRLVGRDHERGQLRGVMSDLLAGRGRIVTIAGEAGLGKSRLMLEWRNEMVGRVRWLEGRAFAHTTGVAYGPFIDLFRRFAAIQDDDSEPSARARLHTAVSSLFGEDREAHALFASMLTMRLTPEESEWLTSIPAQALRERLFADIFGVLERIAHEQPIVLVIEDMHWADASSLDLMETLLPLVERVPIAIVGVFRDHPDEQSSKFVRACEARYPALTLSIRLAPLSESASLEMVTQLLSLRAMPASLQQLILSKAEGNPFFVEEVIRTLIERGALIRANGHGWITTQIIETLSVPDTLQGLLMARLDRLPDETKWVVQQASVIGRIFLYRVLIQMAERHLSLDADLTHLEREELIRERARDPEVEYIFKHALTQEVAYQSLLAPRRRELHRRVGNAMEIVFAQRLSEFHSIIGRHMLRGEVWQKAALHLIEAGDSASRLFAHAEAREHYTGALEALPHLPETSENRVRRVDTIIKLVSTSWIAYVPEENLARLEAEAEWLAKAANDSSENQLRLARIYYWMGRLRYVLNDSRTAIGYYQQVLATARKFGDEELLAIPSSVIGQALTVQGQFGKAAGYFEQAIPALEKTGSVHDWIRSVGFHGVTLVARGHYVEGVAEGERALARALAIKNLSAIAALHVYIAAMHVLGGDSARAVEHGRLAAETGEQSGDRVLVYAGHGFAAWGYSRLGQHETAIAVMEQSQAVARALGGRIILGNWFGAANAEIALSAGHVADALRSAEQVAQTAKAGGDLYGEGVARRVAALALTQSSRYDDAEPHLAASALAFEGGECRAELARTKLAWASLYWARGNRADAITHAEQAAAQFSASAMLSDLQQARTFLQQIV